MKDLTWKKLWLIIAITSIFVGSLTTIFSNVFGKNPKVENQLLNHERKIVRIETSIVYMEKRLDEVIKKLNEIYKVLTK